MITKMNDKSIAGIDHFLKGGQYHGRQVISPLGGRLIAETDNQRARSRLLRRFPSHDMR
jgi:hypothetical protein